MMRSVVATGKVEPITKVEIKSKANGIIERLFVDVDQVVRRRARCWPSSTRKILPHGSARLAPTCRRPRPRAKRAVAQLKKNEIEAEAPDVAFARRNHERARAAVRAEARVAVGARRSAERARTGREPAARRQRPARDRARARRRGHGQRRAGARRRRARRGGAGQRHDQGADPRHRADARRRGRQPGVVDPQPRRQRHAGDDARRHRAGVRARQGGRSRHRPRAARADRARSPPRRFRDRVFEGRVTQISPIGVEKDNVTTFEVEGVDRQRRQGAEGQHDGQRRDRPRAVPRLAARARGGRRLRRPAQRRSSISSMPARETGRRRVPVKVGVGNGTKIQILRRRSRPATRSCCPG